MGRDVGVGGVAGGLGRGVCVGGRGFDLYKYGAGEGEGGGR